MLAPPPISGDYGTALVALTAAEAATAANTSAAAVATSAAVAATSAATVLPHLAATVGGRYAVPRVATTAERAIAI